MEESLTLQSLTLSCFFSNVCKNLKVLSIYLSGHASFYDLLRHCKDQFNQANLVANVEVMSAFFPPADQVLKCFGYSQL